jgi:hypothetical protein
MVVHPVAEKIRRALFAIGRESPVLTEAAKAGQKLWKRRWDLLTAFLLEIVWAVMMAVAKWLSLAARPPAKILHLRPVSA